MSRELPSPFDPALMARVIAGRTSRRRFIGGGAAAAAALTLGSSGANAGETVYFRVTDVASGQVATRVAVANASGVATTTYVVPAAAVPGDELIVISAALRGPQGSESVASLPETLVVE